MKNLLHSDLNIFSIQNVTLKPNHKHKTQSQTTQQRVPCCKEFASFERDPRPVTVNQARINIEGRLKNSQFYRKFINYSISCPKAKQSPEGHSEKSKDKSQTGQQKFLPYQQSIKGEDAAQRNASNSKGIFKQGERRRSFQFFLQNKRRKDTNKRREDKIVQQKPVKIQQKPFHTMCLEKGSKESSRESGQILNLKGKGINKLGSKDSQSPRFMIKMRPQIRSNFTNDLTQSQKIQRQSSERITKLSTIRTQFSNEKCSRERVVRYIFQQSQGYCLFDKNLLRQINKNATTKSIFNFNKRKLINLHRKKSPQNVKLEISVEMTNEIQGWKVSTHEDEEIASNH